MVAKEHKMISNVSDCVCGHPFSSHGEGGCGNPCKCMKFEEAASKISHILHCPICGRFAHANGYCPLRLPRIPFGRA
jgi:hypothetical protein